jgi:hypothetical protein
LLGREAIHRQGAPSLLVRKGHAAHNCYGQRLSKTEGYRWRIQNRSQFDLAIPSRSGLTIRALRLPERIRQRYPEVCESSGILLQNPVKTGCLVHTNSVYCGRYPRSIPSGRTVGQRPTRRGVHLPGTTAVITIAMN